VPTLRSLVVVVVVMVVLVLLLLLLLLERCPSWPRYREQIRETLTSDRVTKMIPTHQSWFGMRRWYGWHSTRPFESKC
jgi:hypothetical protein